MELIEFAELTPRRRAEVEGDEQDPFDSARITLRFRPKDRHVGLTGPDGRLVASTGLVTADIQVGDQRFPVVGIGGVIVRADSRGRGLARAIVEAALAKAGSLGPDFAVLFCHEDRAGLYRRLGFAEVSDEVVVKQPGGYAHMTQLTMWRALHPGARWPPGPVVLHTLPF